jgi:hypothetical protein
MAFIKDILVEGGFSVMKILWDDYILLVGKIQTEHAQSRMRL